MKFPGRKLAIPYGIFMILFVVLPLFIVLYYAFTNGSGQPTFENFLDFFKRMSFVGLSHRIHFGKRLCEKPETHSYGIYHTYVDQLRTSPYRVKRDSIRSGRKPCVFPVCKYNSRYDL